MKVVIFGLKEGDDPNSMIPIKVCSKKMRAELEPKYRDEYRSNLRVREFEVITSTEKIVCSICKEFEYPKVEIVFACYYVKDKIECGYLCPKCFDSIPETTLISWTENIEGELK